MNSDENSGSRKKYSAEQQYRVVKEVLTTDQSVSTVCQKYGISRTMFYRWQEQFLSTAQALSAELPKG